jgi:SAM-dependent methyltransferase
MSASDDAAVVTDSRSRMRQGYEACPLCDSRQFGKLREDDCRIHPCYDPELPPTMIWCICGDCGHCFVDGYLTAEGLELLFKKTHDIQSPAAMFRPPDPTWQPGNLPVEQQRRIWAQIVERVTRLRGVLPTRGDKWVDVGCGNGMLLFTAWEWGYHAIGLDMRKETVEQLQGMQVEAHNLDLLDYRSPPGSIAVISMANVLEHMPFPKLALRHAANLLQQNGLLFLSVPNGDTIVWKYLDSYRGNPYWYEIEHCHNFTKTRLEALLQELGFENLHYDINQRYRTGMELVARKSGALK